VEQCRPRNGKRVSTLGGRCNLVDPDVPQPDATHEEAACEAAEAVEVVEESDCSRDAELEEKQQQLEVLATQYARLRADFDNFRRRSQQKLEEQSERGAERLITKLLPVLDDLDRALEAASSAGSSDGLAEGVSMVQRALLAALHSEGLSQVQSLGTAFDPHCHEAVAREESAGGELYVVAEYQKGYSFAGRLLRPAKVKVGPTPENPTS
jgi:molecular chaperone GrpE